MKIKLSLIAIGFSLLSSHAYASSRGSLVATAGSISIIWSLAGYAIFSYSQQPICIDKSTETSNGAMLCRNESTETCLASNGTFYPPKHERPYEANLVGAMFLGPGLTAGLAALYFAFC